MDIGVDGLRQRSDVGNENFSATGLLCRQEITITIFGEVIRKAMYLTNLFFYSQHHPNQRSYIKFSFSNRSSHFYPFAQIEWLHEQSTDENGKITNFMQFS